MGSLYEISEEEEEKELRAAFKVFDRTGQGFITSNDLRSVLQCLGEQLDQDESKLINHLKPLYSNFIFVCKSNA